MVNIGGRKKGRGKEGAGRFPEGGTADVLIG